ncbi:MAG: 30S ribosomal protein S13 [Elusimicrobia bacterium]|nr:30S ribosomal protein S13 [Elusimicrobiota bacterium]MDE2237623.1 30S ribosomal protein S13 [Elusimicrobiota bacterium]MDE2425334.1 30S ribosomal protein S13 [Elusimicrobiota bacterium]
MARVAGVDLPKNKRIDVALRYLYGIGKTTSGELLEKLNGAIDPKTRVKDLSEAQVGLINNILTKEYKVEGELRRELQGNLHRLSDIGSYRGSRHRRNLPARGQRTRTNARTRRGRRKTVGVGKSVEKK